MPLTFGISELAREFALTPRAIRHYEEQGLLQPQRRGQSRIYDARDRVRLKLILRGKRLGLALTEIKEIIEMYDAEPGELGQLQFLLQRIAQRRQQLLQQREDIQASLAEMAEIEAQCELQLAQLTVNGRANGCSDEI